MLLLLIQPEAINESKWSPILIKFEVTLTSNLDLDLIY